MDSENMIAAQKNVLGGEPVEVHAGGAGSEHTQKPEQRQKGKFRPTAEEKALALGMYVIAYLYAALEGKVWMIFFPLLYVIAVEYMYRDTPRPAESWIWLGSLVTVVLSKYFGHGRIWDEFVTQLSVHILAVWWFLSRSGKLLEKRSGSMLPADALNGYIIFPFGSFFLRIRTLVTGFGKRESGRDSVWKTALGIVLALLLMLVLLNVSANTLSAADESFGTMLSDLRSQMRISGETMGTIFLSLPVGAYLFGQIAGSRRTSEWKQELRRERVLKAGERIRIVPRMVWVIGSVFFCVLYAAFIVWQGSYLFGAFTRSLPENFVVAEYARQGFFELCRVVVLNFLLYWLIIRTGDAETGRGMKATKIMCTLLLAASFLFTVIAMSKMGLYISNFSFTPRRIESCWLTAMLSLGSIAAIYTLWTGKSSLRCWLIVGAVSFALLHIY